ncbi:MAG: HlyD family efflux transporter periplasmic adaptor subunit [Bacteroidetes bacterium]|nr:HlyD family efflux transporter periplasmic adaptor subunit [Bacteroidota bacterium]
MTKKILFLLPLALASCKSDVDIIKPSVESISESIYASGIVKSKSQYQAFASVNGIIENIYFEEGDTLKKGDTILSISNETQRLNKENAQLNAAFSDFNANEGKLNEAELFVDLSKNKMKSDSILFMRQKNLWAQQIGTKIDLEQKELAFQNSKTLYYSAVVKRNDLKRQLDFTSLQSKKNLQISSNLEGDYILKSEIDGILYSLEKSKGEIVSTQTPLAVIGDAAHFILEMQVDEFDILKIKKGLLVMVTLDSYKGKVYEAKVTKVDPLMNERSKTFMVEAEFIVQPELLYPNLTFEANIVLQSKEKALLIPRNYLLNDSIVQRKNGDKIIVKCGLRDYQKIEIISGLSENDELMKPGK